MRNKLTRNKLALTKNSKRPAEVERALEYMGLMSRVAAQMERSLGHVLRVARGERHSKPVMDAILREIRRIEKSERSAAA